MQKLHQTRETYHISIRRKKASKPFEKIRENMVSGQTNELLISNRIAHLQGNINPEILLQILKDLSKIRIQSLNSEIIITFLVNIQLYSQEASNKNLQMRKIYNLSQHLLNIFTSCQDSVILSKLDILHPLLINPSSLMIYSNIVCIQQWSPIYKSNILNSLCKCLSKSSKQLYHLNNLQQILIDPVEISQQSFNLTLDLLCSYFETKQQFLITNKQQDDEQDQFINTVILCLNLLLKYHYKSSQNNVSSHPIISKLRDILSNIQFNLLNKQSGIAILNTIQCFLRLDIQCCEIKKVCQIIDKSLNSTHKQLVFISNQIIKKLINKGKLLDLLNNNIIQQLITLVTIKTSQWDIKMQATITIVYILETIDDYKLMRKMEDKGCFDILKQGLTRGETQVTIKTLKCIEAMIIQLNQVDLFIKKYNINELVNRLIYNKKKQIITEAQRVLQILQQRERRLNQ